MDILLLILIFICLYKSKFYIVLNKFNKLYLSRETTTSIKGIFVLLVFYSHLRQYITFSSIFDKTYLLIQNYLGQLIVCVFLFYSGYGIFESFNKKGKKYISQIPKNRILKTLLHFDIAILLFLFLNIVIGKEMSIFEFLSSLIGWNSIGNSNWFIFTILCCYATTYISFSIFKSEKKSLLMNFFAIFIVFVILSRFKESWWYDTILCYPFGLLFSYLKTDFEKIVLKNNYVFYITSIFVLILFIIFYQIKNIYFFEFAGVLFCLLIVLFSLKINVSNSILMWLGNNVFSIYILQRIPMIFLSKYFELGNYSFVFASFIITILISVLFNKLTYVFDKLIFRKENNHEK